MNTVNEALEMAGIELRDLIISEHESGYTTLDVLLGDNGEIIDAIIDTPMSLYESACEPNNWHKVWSGGTGPIPCNCDNCMSGIPPDERIIDSDELVTLRDTLEDRLAKIIS